MNALINSQVEELDKYARIYEDRTGNPLPFRYASYTGQLKEDERAPWRENPPDLLLTNYMMLELILTRVLPGIHMVGVFYAFSAYVRADVLRLGISRRNTLGHAGQTVEDWSFGC